MPSTRRATSFFRVREEACKEDNRSEKPITNLENIQAMIPRGLAALNVKLDATWSFEHVEAELKLLFLAFFRYLRNLTGRRDGFPH